MVLYGVNKKKKERREKKKRTTRRWYNSKDYHIVRMNNNMYYVANHISLQEISIVLLIYEYWRITVLNCIKRLCERVFWTLRRFLYNDYDNNRLAAMFRVNKARVWNLLPKNVRNFSVAANDIFKMTDHATVEQRL